MRGASHLSFVRQRFLLSLLAFAALFAFFPLPRSFAQTLPALDAVRVASGLTEPLFVTAAPADYNRLFIVTKRGFVYILNLQTGLLNSAPFLDISSLVSLSSEEGLVGLAFDPNYATNGKFYVYYVGPNGAYGQGVSHVSQFKVSASNPDLADTSDEKSLLTFDQPQPNHNGGWIGFSPRPGDENNLYIASGDGGNGDDQGTGHIEPGGNAQNTTTLLGKMLRIHIDSAAGTYSIPANNPFFGSTTARQEIFAYGLRNPFRDSFDRATGVMYLGDVGQSTREEVDVQKPSNAGGGENYGWRVREGIIQNPAYPSATPPPGAVDPIIDYPRSTGGTVTGGYVYRGKQIPALRGTYIFGDYLVSKIFALNFDGTVASNFVDITSDLFPTATGGYALNNPASFGEDANGEIYIVAIGSGSIFKIVPPTPTVDSTVVARQPGGGIVITANGLPFKPHTVQAANTLVETFTTIGNATAGGDGVVKYTDANPGSSRFYRVIYP